jgi:predicted nucleic acid-binding protein
VISGFLSPHGPPGRLLEWLRQGEVQAVLDARIASEYDEVSTRPELGLPTDDVRTVLVSVLSQARWVEVGPADQIRGLPGPDDAPFAECARITGCPLVTGNARHFPREAVGGLKVVTPREYCDLLRGLR